MKKKVMFGLVSAALAAVMCVGFAGCGAADAKSVTGEKVTEKQWNAALEYFTQSDAVYTVTYRMEESAERKFEYLDEKLSGGMTSVSGIEAVKNGTKEYVKMTEKTEISGDMKKIAAALDTEVETSEETEEKYAVLNGLTYTVYAKNSDEKWATSSSSSSIIPIRSVIAGLPLTYSSYEYSSDLKGYVVKNSFKSGSMYVVKFNGDGKLSAIYYNSESTVKTGNCERKSSDTLNIVIEYWAKEITMPTIGSVD